MLSLKQLLMQQEESLWILSNSMSNFFTPYCILEALPASREDYEELISIIQEADDNNRKPPSPDEKALREWHLRILEDNFHPPMITFDNSSNELIIFHPDSVPEPIKWLHPPFHKRFFDKLGSIMKTANKDYITFGVAYTSDKFQPSAFAGTEFRLFQDGTYEYPQFVYKRSK